MKKIELRKVSKGGYFRFRDYENSPLWVRDIYDPSCKRYVVFKSENVNGWSLRKGSLMVYVEE